MSKKIKVAHCKEQNAFFMPKNGNGAVWICDTPNDGEVEINELCPELILDADVCAGFGDTDDFFAYLQENCRQSYCLADSADSENWNARLRGHADGYVCMPCNISTRVLLVDYAWEALGFVVDPDERDV